MCVCVCVSIYVWAAALRRQGGGRVRYVKRRARGEFLCASMREGGMSHTR